MDFTEYSRIPAINWSMLKLLAQSPLHYKWAMDHPEELVDKAAWVLGRAAHCRILEPHEYERRVAVWTGGRRTGKEWQAFVADHPGMDIVTAGEAEAIEYMAEAVAESEAGAMLTGGDAEVTIQWGDAVTGLVCKGRPDYITPARLVDLKTTRDPAPWRFRTDAGRYLYHGQLAFYAMGAPRPERPVIVSVQSVPPYDVVVYRMTEADLDAGLRLVRELLSKLVACQAADIWPGVAPGVVDLDLPTWAPGAEDPDTAEIDGLDWSE